MKKVLVITAIAVVGYAAWLQILKNLHAHASWHQVPDPLN